MGKTLKLKKFVKSCRLREKEKLWNKGLRRFFYGAELLFGSIQLPSVKSRRHIAKLSVD